MARAVWQRLADRAVLAAVELATNRRYKRVLRLPRKEEPKEVRSRRRPIAVPGTGNEKFAWRKIFDHNPRFPILSDKLACREWLDERVTALNPPHVQFPRLLWVGDDPEELPIELLKRPVIIKTSHGWRDRIIVRNGQPGRAEIVERMKKSLEKDHGRRTMEWSYLDVPRRVLVEELILDGAPLEELNFFAFGRKIVRVMHFGDRFGDFRRNAYEPDARGELQLIKRPAEEYGEPLAASLPDTLATAMEIARDVGQEFDQVRVDFMTDRTHLWLSEVTVYNLSGFFSMDGHDPMAPTNLAWDLRRSWFLSTPQPGWRGVYAGALRRWLDDHPAPDTPGAATPPLPPASVSAE